jgi:TolB-like protein
MRWAFQSARIGFRRLPWWVRVVALSWLGIVLLSRGCTPHHHEADRISSAAADKLKVIAGQYQGSSNAADIAKLGDQIAREFAEDDSDTPTARRPILAIPFTAPAGNSAAEKVADSVFAMVYGRVAIAHHGQVGLAPNPLPACDLSSALERGRASHASYVLCGAIDAATPNELTVKIAAVADKTILWSKSYPVAGADASKVASEVAGRVPSSGDE